MWWTYFDRFAEGRTGASAPHKDPVLAAADGYSYIHLVIVAGIIIFAGGIRLVVHNKVRLPMPEPGRLAMCGGVAVYLFGLAAFAADGTREFSRAGGLAAALMGLFALGASIPAWTVAAGIVALAALCAAETLLEGRDDATEQHRPEAATAIAPEREP